MFSFKVPFLVMLSCIFQLRVIQSLNFHFPAHLTDDSNNDRLASFISTEDLQQFVQQGTDSLDKQSRLEDTILSYNIVVKNGTTSHAQLLDALPNSEAIEDSKVARGILKSSLWAYNSKCAPKGISGEQCADFLEKQPLPVNTELHENCSKILQSRRDGHHPFRRLLPRNYRDGFYEIPAKNNLPTPHHISNGMHSRKPNRHLLDDSDRSLALVQWTQFIEHDLSKPVVSTTSNGQPIECCSEDSYKLLPRYRHPACAPMFATDKYGKEICLNYVRSSLIVGSKCNFGAAEQLNQATGNLDLSQLYGFTDEAKHQMRAYVDGKLKSTGGGQLHQELLPVATEGFKYCALALNASGALCFMAGDSRVNSNPYAIAIYTLFLRNHNQIADTLKHNYVTWNDERLFATARSINIGIYRRIVFTELMPAILGDSIARKVNEASKSLEQDSYVKVSNEFGVAAIRFYFSMMPDALHKFNSRPTGITNNNIISDSNIFVLKDQIYKPTLKYTATELDNILESLLHQSAMKMDAAYVESLISENWDRSRPIHSDILAFDIQRGRDHGLQGYAKYLEICSGVKIDGWQDLGKFIVEEVRYLVRPWKRHRKISRYTRQTLATALVQTTNFDSMHRKIQRLSYFLQLRDVYSSWADIDLIVGGLLETPLNGSVTGPTFSCILGEQLSWIRQWLNSHPETSDVLSHLNSLTAADILCVNSDLQYVPKNIFQLASERNPLISCASSAGDLTTLRP